MPHYCRICNRARANERFSGKGHARHICRDCQRLPKEQIERVDLKEELSNFLRQSHISLKNLKRLETLSLHSDPGIAALAKLIHEVARLTPFKRRRIPRLAAQNDHLLRALYTSGLDLPDYYYDGSWYYELDDLDVGRDGPVTAPGEGDEEDIPF